MKLNSAKRSYLLLAGILLAAIVVAVLTSSKPEAASAKAPAGALEEGLAYLEQQAGKDPAEVDKGIKDRDDANREKARAALLEKLCQDDEATVWSMFNDYVLLGEALATGFSDYGKLSADRVLANSSDTINSIPKRLNEAAALHPSVVFLCFGNNDLYSGNWPTPSSYAKDMVEMVELAREKIPGARVVVSSILPVQGNAVNRSEYWAQIPEYNAALEKACKKNHIEFADVSQLAAEHAELWDGGGVYLRAGFYRYWASCLIVPVEVPAYEN